MFSCQALPTCSVFAGLARFWRDEMLDNDEFFGASKVVVHIALQ